MHFYSKDRFYKGGCNYTPLPQGTSVKNKVGIRRVKTVYSMLFSIYGNKQVCKTITFGIDTLSLLTVFSICIVQAYPATSNSPPPTLLGVKGMSNTAPSIPSTSGCILAGQRLAKNKSKSTAVLYSPLTPLGSKKIRLKIWLKWKGMALGYSKKEDLTLPP